MKSLFIYILSGSLQRVSFLFLIPLFTRLLPEDEFGIYSFWMTIYTLLQLFIGLGFDAAINRLYYDFKSNSNEALKYLGSVLCFQWIILIPMTILFGAILLLVMVSFFKEFVVFPFLPLIVSSASLLKIFESVLAAFRSARKPGMFCLSTFISFASLFVFIGLLLFKLNLGLIGFFIALTLSNLISSALVTFLLLKNFDIHSFSFSFIKESLSYGLPTIPGKFGGWVGRFSNKLLIVQALSPLALSQFQVASVPLSLITLFAVSVNNAYVPWFYSKAILLSEYNPVDKAQCRLEIIYETRNFDASLIILYAIFSLPFLFFPEFIVTILAPIDAYSEAVRYLPFLSFSAFIFCQYTLWNRFLTFNKNNHLSSLTLLVPGIIGVALNIILMPIFGLIVPALVSILCSLLSFILAFYYSFHKSQIAQAFRSDFMRLQLLNLITFIFLLFPIFYYPKLTPYSNLDFALTRLFPSIIYCFAIAFLYGHRFIKVLNRYTL